MNITVHVDEVALDTVIRESYEGDGWTIGNAVAHQVVQRLTEDREGWDAIRSRVRRIQDEEIREAVRPLIAEALTRPIQQANRFGEPVGEQTTLSAVIVAEAQAFMAKKTGDYRNERTMLQGMVAEAVAAAFRDEVADAVKQARIAVTGAIGAQVAEAVATAVQKGLAAR